MIINNNIPALNTFRQMGINQNNMQKSMEKLSSGLRINRAGDDAAGLAISEKMRAQIRGLDQASRNSQDGISLIQTAEGALDEAHNILQRMRELAVQSSNDTNVDVDRNELQKEVNQLAEELTRIADTTEFNTQKLLDGTFEGTFHIGSNSGQNLSLTVGDMSSDTLGVGFERTEAIDSTALDALSADTSYSVVKFEEIDTGGGDLDGAVYGLENKDGELVATSTDGATWTALGTAAKLDEVDDSTAHGTATFTFDAAVTTGRVTVGEEYTDSAGDTFVDVTAVGGISIDSQDSADSAITLVNNAIEAVSSQRSNLGAVQNRLEHTISNLDNSAENLQAAESRIRDVDMAKEMMEMTRANILSQASQAMLAQANQLPQSVLQLLG